MSIDDSRLRQVIEAYVEMQHALENMPEGSGSAEEIMISFIVWRQRMAVPALSKATALLVTQETRQ